MSPESWHRGSKASVTASGVGNDDWSARTLPRCSVHCAGALRGAENAPASCFPTPLFTFPLALPASFWVCWIYLLHLEPDTEPTSSNRIMAIHHCAICERLVLHPSLSALSVPAAPQALTGTHKHAHTYSKRSCEHMQRPGSISFHRILNIDSSLLDQFAGSLQTLA